MSALTSARFISQKLGHVIVGIRPAYVSRYYPVGHFWVEWGGGKLEGHCLVLLERADRAEWEAQWKLLFPDRPCNKPARGERFFRAKLREWQ